MVFRGSLISNTLNKIKTLKAADLQPFLFLVHFAFLQKRLTSSPFLNINQLLKVANTHYFFPQDAGKCRYYLLIWL